MTGRLALAVSVALTFALDLQTVRDVRPEPSGAVVLGGVVTSDDAQPRPLRRVSVQLSGGGLMTSRVIVTGDDGRFSFAGLPAGQYTMQAYKSGFMRTNYGAKRPSGPGLSIVVADGQRLTDLRIRLSRYATITGTIYDQNGEPAEGVLVEALFQTLRTGIRALGPVYGRALRTDDRGVYRYVGLDPGEYLIAAGPSGKSGFQQFASGDIDRVLQALAGGGPLPAMSPRSVVTPARVFYPGVTELASATLISVKAGEERSGIDLTLQLVPTARIEGTVTNSNGQPAPNIAVTAKLLDVPASMDLFRVGDPGATQSDAQGRFSYSTVSPGQYEIAARSAPAANPAAGQSGSSPGLQWALTTVAMSGADQTVSLALQSGVTVSGRIAFDGTTLKPPANLATVRVSLAIPGYGPTVGASTALARADGTFTIAGVAPGRFRLAATLPGSTPVAGWALRSGMVNGVDALDAPIEIRLGQNIDDAVITFTDHPAELSGALQTPAGVLASDYFIIVFSTDRTQWSAQSRRTIMARPTNLGRYSARNLPPGEYYIAAVTDVLANEWFDPAFLEQLVPTAVRVTLAESEQKTQDLRIAGR